MSRGDVLSDDLNFYGKCCNAKITEELTLDIFSVLWDV